MYKYILSIIAIGLISAGCASTPSQCLGLEPDMRQLCVVSVQEELKARHRAEKKAMKLRAAACEQNGGIYVKETLGGSVVERCYERQAFNDAVIHNM